jgi:LuxR family maltose regulon positive regulatory protein
MSPVTRASEAERVAGCVEAQTHGPGGARPHSAAPVRPRLSPREEEVLGLIAGGYADKEIATRLGLSIYTVINHARNIRRKTGVKSRMAAVAVAREWGVIA